MKRILHLHLIIPKEFAQLCESHGCTPGDVLRGFMADLCGLDGSHGSDERNKARDYFERCPWTWGGL